MVTFLGIFLTVTVAGGDEDILSKDIDCTKLATKECLRLHDEYGKALSARRDAGNGWVVGCWQDKVTLRWTCFASKHFGESQIRIDHVGGASGYCFSGPLNNHPGNSAVVRFGENEPITYGRRICGSEAGAVIAQMLEEPKGAARGVTWPGKTEEFEFDLAGFRNAYRVLLQRVDKPSP